jgi:hypothetical protein
LVKCLLVSCSVAVVLVEGLGKVMVAREVLLGAEVVVMVVFGIQHGLDGGDGRDADGSRGKPLVFIGVVG